MTGANASAASQGADTLLDRHDAVLFDLDGTVYHGARPIPVAADAVAHVRARGRAVRFVTNNASKTPDEVTEHLGAVGVPAGTEEVSTSAQAAAAVLADRLPRGAEVLVVGTTALADEVRAAGLYPVREAGPAVAAVVQGHSPDTAWPDLAEACVALRAGALWVACNADTTLPSERGELPGNGSMVAALRTATGGEPQVAGKPRAPLLHTAATSAGARDPLVVGDRLDTDIAGAVEAGYRSLAVLTGVATPAGLLAAREHERPDFLAADLTVLTADVAATELEIGPRAAWRVERDGDVVTVATGDAAPGNRDSGNRNPDGRNPDEQGVGTDGVGAGSDAALDLLRCLCAVAWRTGITDVRAVDDRAAAVLTELRLR